ncbi:MAG TPA: pyrimidine-nucleoside phosphorylase, partial [Firmicutes bacterium]|nr:pyrimidine-nucleoside phosphorylase [Bacillota bacterium]
GYVQGIRAEAVGTAAMILGAGRAKQGDKIDAAAGVVLEKKVGDKVSKGETLAIMHTNYAPDSEEVVKARELLSAAYLIKDKKQETPPLLLGRVDKEGISREAR